MSFPRRHLMIAGLVAGVAGATGAGCAATGDEDADEPTPDETGSSEQGRPSAGWKMPAEESEHERTWMCWPSSRSIWGDDLELVQDTIETIAVTIAEFEPVTMLCRPDQFDALTERLGGAVGLLEAPVDDLWARDTLPCFLVRTDGRSDSADVADATLAAGQLHFNGWGGKQVHQGDAQLCELVAEHLGVPVADSGLVGEGGGLEVDGSGTVLAARSSWVNENRNPGLSERQIELALLDMLGADRLLWVDGLAGEDITDGHIDTLARFAGADTVVVDVPAVDDPDDPWAQVSGSTRASVEAARTPDGAPYRIVEIVQPATPRGEGDDFLATYMNYYVCNGAVIAPQFGDPAADAAARSVLEALFGDRKVIMLNIDALAAGGGGIHCATQQQPVSP
jgi:agmatine deiminase